MISFSYNLLSGGSGGGGSGPNTNVPPTLGSGVDIPELAYATLAIDPVSGDLPEKPFIARGADAVVQKIRSRFRFFKGEWFLDTRLGVPYLQSVFIKRPNQALITSIFSKVLTDTPGVNRVVRFSSSWDRDTRTLTTDFEAVLDDGTIIRATSEPFIIEIQ